MEGTEYTIDAGRDIFHEYVLEKSPGSDTVNFEVDGKALATGISQTSSNSNQVEWGSLSPSDRGIADYNLVMFEIFPPAANYLSESYLLDGDAEETISGQPNSAIDVQPTQDLLGEAGGAVLFSSPTSRIELPGSTFEPDSGFTITAWIRLDDPEPGALNRIVSNWDGDLSGDDSGALVLETYTDPAGSESGLRFTVFNSSDTPVTAFANKGIEAGRWHLITARLVSGHMEIFIDNRSVAKTHLGESSVATNDFQWGIGCDGEGPASSDTTFSGAIDEVGFYSEALSDSDIRQLISDRLFVYVDGSIMSGDTDVPQNAGIVIVFDEDVDETTATSAAFELKGSRSGLLPAEIFPFGRSVTIDPAELLPKGEVIQVVLNSQLQSVSGIPLQPYTLEFETVATDREQLYWSDTNSRSASFSGLFVDTAMGSFLQETPTLSVQSVRPMALAIRYDSTFDRYRGSFGYGWSHAYEARIDVLSDDTLVVYYDALRHNTFNRVDDTNNFESIEEAALFDRLRIGGEGGFFWKRQFRPFSKEWRSLCVRPPWSPAWFWQ